MRSIMLDNIKKLLLDESSISMFNALGFSLGYDEDFYIDDLNNNTRMFIQTMCHMNKEYVTAYNNFYKLKFTTKKGKLLNLKVYEKEKEDTKKLIFEKK